MENSYNAPREIEIDLADLIWKLLMQWKAMLLVCIACALLFSGIKYAKDTNAYKAELADKKKAEEEASKPVEERIDAVLKLLPADQREDVLFLVQQKDMVDVQKEYLNNSILLNTDPARQRQFSIKFVLKSENGTDMRTLADAYSICLHRTSMLKSLREIISPDTSLEYIDELIDTRNTDILAGDAESAIYTVTITLPDDVDADRITELIDSEVRAFHNEINSNVGEHSILRTNVEDRAVFNKDIIDRRANLTYTINNLNNSIDNAKGKLSAEQNAAYESIVVIKQSSEAAQNVASKDEVSSDTQKPGFSKKYAVLGFALGAFLYAGIFVVLLVLKKVVASASTAQSYTDTRLLGEVYRKANHKGLMWLLTSDMIARWRYKDKLDADKQISVLASTVDAVCAHHDINKLTLILSGVEDGFSDIIDRIVKACSSEGNNKISIDLINADKMDEKTLGLVKNAIYILCSNSKVDNLGNLITLIKDYDVSPLGTVYLEEL